MCYLAKMLILYLPSLVSIVFLFLSTTKIYAPTRINSHLNMISMKYTKALANVGATLSPGDVLLLKVRLQHWLNLSSI